MENVDALIDAGWVIPVEPSDAVLPEHSIAIHQGLVVAVLPTPLAHSRFQSARRFNLRGHALIPGLINLHTHAGMALLRGLADDVPHKAWLNETILPAQRAHVCEEFVADGTLLACAEMLRGGITCFNDMYYFPAAVAHAAAASGMRAAIGMIAADAATSYAFDIDDYLAKGLAVRDACKEEPLLSFCVAPCSSVALSERSLARVVAIAEELDLPIHVHAHSAREEIDASLARHGARPLERLRALGAVSPRLIAVDAVHLTEHELDLIARHGASVAHCPSANLKCASGFAPVPALLARGVNIGLGSDSAASNNRLDIFQEMRTAALIAKACSGDARVFPAAQALCAATIHAARALGIDGVTGLILPGKSADLCAVDFESPGLKPCYEPVSHLVYAASRDDVSHVWVAGRLLVEDGELISLTSADLDKKVRMWHYRLRVETKT